MDLDNFDFKPLTSGLGFDKKAEQTKVAQRTPSVDRPKETKIEDSEPTLAAVLAATTKEIKNNKPDLFERSLDKTSKAEASKTIQDMLSALPPSLDFVENKKEKGARNYNPVGRQEYVTPAYDKPKVDLNTEIPTHETRDNIDISLDNTLEKAFPKVGFRKPFFHQTVEVKPQFTPVNASITSAVIDALVILGMTALFLVSLVVFTKIDLIAVLLHTQAPMSVWLEVGAIFMGVYLLYYLCTRGFWGSTLGDWAFDIQLGHEEDRSKWYYPGVLVLRMSLVALTGFIVMPLLSLLVKKDLAGKLTGLNLYSKNY